MRVLQHVDPAMFHNDGHSSRLVISALVLTFAGIVHAAETQPLSGAVIRGSSVYTSAELFGAYRSELGKPIDRTSARAVITAVEAMYERDGYARPEISADAALLENGILQLDVSEPRISEVAMKGDCGPHRITLERLAAPLAGMQPIRRTEVQRALARMRELPGLTLSATTRRDGAQGNGFVLDVQTSFDPLDGMVRMSNRGTEDVGPAFIAGQAIANGLFGRGEKLGLVATAATDLAEYRGGGAFVDAPLGDSGTRAFVLAFVSLSEPAIETGEPLDRYARDRLTLRVTRPLVKSSRFDLAASAAFDADDFEIVRDGEELREERLRVLQAGSRLTWRSGGSTQYSISLELRQGLDDFGASLQATDLPDDLRRADFLLTRLNAVRLTQLNERWSLRLDLLAQASGYVLPYSERFKIGGERLGRGFEVTEVAGDSGVGAKVELRRSFAPQLAFVGRPSVYGFYDVGAAWAQDASGRASAATGGLGIAAHAGRVTGYLEVAKPLTRPDVEGRKSATVFAEISVPF
jgi:hemolysin activation/secretion protein